MEDKVRKLEFEVPPKNELIVINASGNLKVSTVTQETLKETPYRQLMSKK